MANCSCQKSGLGQPSPEAHGSWVSRQKRRFETKLQLGLKMVKRVKAHGRPFDLLACDALYGREGQLVEPMWMPQGWTGGGPLDTHGSLSEPRVGVPEKRGKGDGRARNCTCSPGRDRAETSRLRPRFRPEWRRPWCGHTERGRLAAGVYLQRVWTVAGGTRPRAEWLVIRRDAEGDCSYLLLNAPEDSPHEHLIAWSCRRYFAERTFEDAGTEIGWDEFQAQKYRAWEHHLALTTRGVVDVARTQWVGGHRPILVIPN